MKNDEAANAVAEAPSLPAFSAKYIEHYRLLFNAFQDAIVIMDADTSRVLHVNTTFKQLLGYDEGDILGENYATLYPPESSPEADDPNDLQVFGGVVSAQKILKKNSDVCPMDLTMTPVMWEKQMALLVTMRDVTEHQHMKEQLIELSRVDMLTGIYNRRYFMEQCEQRFHYHKRYQHPLAVLMLDTDHFKKINDTYGHAQGDRVLQSLAECCKKLLRKTDVFGRIGGEEFAICLPEAVLENAAMIAERIRCACENNAVDSEKGPLLYTVSIGVAEMEQGVRSFSALLSKADAALYKAKEAGRNNIQTT